MTNIDNTAYKYEPHYIYELKDEFPEVFDPGSPAHKTKKQLAFLEKKALKTLWPRPLHETVNAKRKKLGHSWDDVIEISGLQISYSQICACHRKKSVSDKVIEALETYLIETDQESQSEEKSRDKLMGIKRKFVHQELRRSLETKFNVFDLYHHATFQLDRNVPIDPAGLDDRVRKGYRKHKVGSIDTYAFENMFKYTIMVIHKNESFEICLTQPRRQIPELKMLAASLGVTVEFTKSDLRHASNYRCHPIKINKAKQANSRITSRIEAHEVRKRPAYSFDVEKLPPHLYDPMDTYETIQEKIAAYKSKK